MILKFTSFLIGIIWSYSIIKTQSVFSKKAGLIFKIFITKVSWFTLIAAIYFGYKNFQIKFVLIGLIIGLIIVNLGFYFLKKIMKTVLLLSCIHFHLKQIKVIDLLCHLI